MFPASFGYLQPNTVIFMQMSKQQKMDAEAAAKFASAMGMAGVASGGSSGLNPSAVAAAAALQAAHQQMLRMPPSQQLPAHLLPFSPLLYPYQMAMAQVCRYQERLIHTSPYNFFTLAKV
jgi:hypothetical protein